MAPVDKFSVSLPEELAAELDDIAKAEGLTRSAVVREATADYVAARRAAEYQTRRREQIDRAIAGFQDMATRWGPDERTGLHYLGELRGGTTADDRPGPESLDDCP
jgi:predicted transcriptional regulator